MLHRATLGVIQQVLLRYISHIMALIILREEVIVWLILARTHMFGNGFPPFLGVGKFRVDVKDHASEGIEAVFDDLTDLKFRYAIIHGSYLATLRLYNM
tara:strand:+ start:2563 stop:2859 length:297 start_codon:yes stop_codon:yes gene_type:complete